MSKIRSPRMRVLHEAKDLHLKAAASFRMHPSEATKDALEAATIAVLRAFQLRRRPDYMDISGVESQIVCARHWLDNTSGQPQRKPRRSR